MLGSFCIPGQPLQPVDAQQAQGGKPQHQNPSAHEHSKLDYQHNHNNQWVTKDKAQKSVIHIP